MKKLIIMMAVLAIAGSALAMHPTDKCYSCHVPHNAVELSGMPLWAGSSHQFNSPIVAYASDTMQATQAGSSLATLSGSTIVCLSCHDNSTSSHYPVVNSDENNIGGAVDEVAGNLQESHPIEMIYNADLVLLDNELNNPTEAPLGMLKNRGSLEATLLEGPAGSARVTCISCHEVHINGLHSYTTDPLAEEGSYEQQMSGLLPADKVDGMMIDEDGLAWIDTLNVDGTTANGGAGDGIADTLGYGGAWSATGSPSAYNETIVRAEGSTHTFSIPHLVNVTGIGYSTVTYRPANLADPSEYSITWGALCRVCHIK